MDNEKLIQRCTCVCKVCGCVCVCVCVAAGARVGGVRWDSRVRTDSLLKLRFHMIHCGFMGWLSLIQGLYRDILWVGYLSSKAFTGTLYLYLLV